MSVLDPCSVACGLLLASPCGARLFFHGRFPSRQRPSEGSRCWLAPRVLDGRALHRLRLDAPGVDPAPRRMGPPSLRAPLRLAGPPFAGPSVRGLLPWPRASSEPPRPALRPRPPSSGPASPRAPLPPRSPPSEPPRPARGRRPCERPPSSARRDVCSWSSRSPALRDRYPGRTCRYLAGDHRDPREGRT